MKDKIAVIEMGTNDIYHITDGYVDEYIDAVAALHARKTIVLSIFPRHLKEDSEDINQKICLLNKAIQAKVIQKGWVYVDVFSLMLQNGDVNLDYYTDGIHLSPHGYELVSCELKKKL